MARQRQPLRAMTPRAPRVPVRVVPRARRVSRFDRPPSHGERQFVRVATVMIGSAISGIVPVVATTPMMPSLGFLTLIAWRLLGAERLPIWGAIPLGLFDDLLNGSPIGTSVALWTSASLIIDIVDQRMLWRDYKQDWAVAAALIAAERLGALILNNFAGGGTDAWVILPQIVVSILLYPLVARTCAGLDRWRW